MVEERKSGPPVRTIIISLSALLAIALGVIVWMMVDRSASVPDPRGNASASALGGGAGGVDPQAFGWIIGDWGYANCSLIVHVARAPGGIAVTAGSGTPSRERVRSANAEEIVTDSARYIRAEDQVRWMSGEVEITRLVPCRPGAETP